MQQATAGMGRGLGPGGMPTPAQIAQMQVRNTLEFAGNLRTLMLVFYTHIQRQMPPGLLQQMRQSGGGMQDIMKAMMGGASDQEMAEMRQMMQQMAGGMGGGMGSMLQNMMGGMGGGLGRGR
ncbi:hypothetical protein FRC00_008024 [Tulasnella sp. 408]|nr:hypothetical protein FRC00_008024 [Tulasnella sp. 408]